MNWGGFGSGFSSGFNSGVKMGSTINDLVKEDKLARARQSGIDDAGAKRDAFIAAAVREQGIPQATEATAPTEAPKDLNGTPQASPAPQAASYPAAEDPMTADRGQPPPVDSSLAGAPAPTPKEPALGATPQASPAPKEPVPDPAKEPVKEPVATSGLPGAGKKARFAVGDKVFDTREQALEYAKSSAPSVMDFMAKTLVPKMQQAYLEQGDVEKAEAWGKWAKDRENERHMESWAKAFKAYQSGDFVSSAKHLVDMHADFPDGNTIVGAEPVKDKAGNVTGFNMSVKNDATGETRAQFVDPKTLTEYGLGALSPDKMFNAVYQRQTQADALTAKARIDAQNDARTAAREEARDNRTAAREDAREERRAAREAENAKRAHGYKLEEMATGEELKAAGVTAQEKAKVQGKIDILKENGLSPEAIKELIPHMVGGDGYKKSTSPEEARRLLLTERVKDPLFSSKKPDEQKRIIDQDMQTIYGAPAAASPAAGGIPGASSAAPAKKGTPFLTPDGKVVYR